MPAPCFLLATGSYLPAQVVTNDQLVGQTHFTADDILRRTGIASRHVAADHEQTSDLALQAAWRALDSAALTPHDLDLIVLATSSPDTVLPATACRLQAKLGCRPIQAFDVNCSCAGFLNALSCAEAMVRCGRSRRALVVGAELRSRFTNPHDTDTFALYGDGAGAVVVSSEGSEGAWSLARLRLGTDGNGAELITIPAGGSREPASLETVRARRHAVTMQGRAVFRRAVRAIPEELTALCAAAGFGVADLELIVPHQMNRRMLEAVAKRMDLPLSRFVVTVDHSGNTSAASIPLALDEAARDGRLNDLSRLALIAFGGGLAWGSALLAREG